MVKGQQVLTSWKEIASYLGKGVRTVQRWEVQLALPVHRPGPDRHIVIAFPSELDAWAHPTTEQRRNNAAISLDQLERMRTLVERMVETTRLNRERASQLMKQCENSRNSRKADSLPFLSLSA
jgi:hypothetical protein